MRWSGAAGAAAGMPARARASILASAAHATPGAPERAFVEAALAGGLSLGAVAMQLATLERQLRERHHRATCDLIYARGASWRANMAARKHALACAYRRLRTPPVRPLLFA
eukprot:9629150-Lingulodinium_polyedra.AAC.1